MGISRDELVLAALRLPPLTKKELAELIEKLAEEIGTDAVKDDLAALYSHFLPKVTASKKAKGDDLAADVAWLAPVVPKADVRLYLRFIYRDRDTAALVATDGHRVHISHRDTLGTYEPGYYEPRTMVRVCGNNDTTHENYPGRYPSFMRVVPKKEGTRTARLDDIRVDALLPIGATRVVLLRFPCGARTVVNEKYWNDLIAGFSKNATVGIEHSWEYAVHVYEGCREGVVMPFRYERSDIPEELLSDPAA